MFLQSQEYRKKTNTKLMIIIFWEMTLCGSYKNRRFGGSYRLHLQGVRVQASTERVVSSCLDSDSYEVGRKERKPIKKQLLTPAMKQERLA
jgi:hypothetical protein